MGDGLDMLGAKGDGLKDQFIVLNVKHIDADKLRKGIGATGAADAGISVALSVVDSQPKMALDLGLPIAKRYLRENLGVDAEITAANVAPQARGKSEFFSGAVVGAGVSVFLIGVGWGTWKLLLKRIFT